MRKLDEAGEAILLSASDLTRFQGCAHATSLDLRFLRGEPLVPVDSDASAQLLQEKGNEHEQAYLERLQADGRSVATIERVADLSASVRQTVEALHRGPDVVYQAALHSGVWSGYADFLERTPRPSKLGDFSYEIVDTKLKRTPAPAHLLQLCLYADLLADVQGTAPEFVHVVLGDGRRESFATRDFAAYTRRLRSRLEDFIRAPGPTRPEPVPACDFCRWRDHCQAGWERADDLCLVAGIRRSQRERLAAAGIGTMQKLGESDGRFPRIDVEILAGLRQQARLQSARRRGGSPRVELRPAQPGLGLERLPAPASGDLFFDMEGDPLVSGGLEYLFGVYDETSGEQRFTAIWAHGREEEPVALAQLLGFFDEHLRRYPDAHIYHYGHYEVTALKRLASRDGVGEGILDRLLYEQRFVDLYRTVQQGIRTSEPGYSLKDLEVFYRERRGDGVATATDSVVAYERYRQTGDPAILEDIRAYNETDCRSTKGLRDWLVSSVRPPGMQWRPMPRDQATPGDDGEATSDRLEAERLSLRQQLAPAIGRLGQEPTDLLFELAFFHKREDRPAWWAIFDWLECESGELVDDLECLAGLVADGPAVSAKKGIHVRPYRFPPQETKLRAGSTASLRAQDRPDVKIVSLDTKSGSAELQFGKKFRDLPEELDLMPGDPIRKTVIRAAIVRVIADVASGAGRYPAIVNLLRRERPRLVGLAPGAPLIDEAGDLIDETAAAIQKLDGSYLPIQGPPGTGKTYVSSHAILRLVRAGKRVAVASNAHKAIDNLMVAVADRAREQGVELRAVKKGNPGDEAIDPLIHLATKNEDLRLASASLVGGTTWLFSREEHDGAFDYLFVDEAGQVSLANIVAMATAARNIVLVGDPMQLGQPTQGVHPGDSGKSVLEFVLAGHATVPADRGIFFPESRRMHPAVCGFVSQLAYEGRLRSAPETARQRLVLKGADGRLAPFGIRFVEVEHEGRSQSSPEEARTLAEIYRSVLGQQFQDRQGATRRIVPDDILVVAPYNAQVNLLQSMLPPGARVGTVDRFQGQEAPVSLLSMATSSGQDLPRDVDFLFSVNRLNVALSRAQALAVVVASPRLLDVACSTVDQMRLVNGLCALREYVADSAAALKSAPP